MASFFLSRIDVLVDGLLSQRIQRNGVEPTGAADLFGASALASARPSPVRRKYFRRPSGELATASSSGSTS